MGLFNKPEGILKLVDYRIGDFDPTKPGCYDNVKTFPLPVKPKHSIYFRLSSNVPVSIAFADADHGSLYHKEEITTEFVSGPIPVGQNREVGLLLGTFPGDKADVNIEVWMEKS